MNGVSRGLAGGSVFSVQRSRAGRKRKASGPGDSRLRLRHASNASDAVNAGRFRPQGLKLCARRSQTVEPFDDWLKSLFELEHGVWHRGLDNNRAQLLAAIFAYQVLLRCNHHCGKQNGQVRWIIDMV